MSVILVPCGSETRQYNAQRAALTKKPSPDEESFSFSSHYLLKLRVNLTGRWFDWLIAQERFASISSLRRSIVHLSRYQCDAGMWCARGESRVIRGNCPIVDWLEEGFASSAMIGSKRFFHVFSKRRTMSKKTSKSDSQVKPTQWLIIVLCVDLLCAASWRQLRDLCV